MVEQEAVNFEVTGSSPVVGAIKNSRPFGLAFFIPRRPADIDTMNVTEEFWSIIIV